MKHKLLIWIIAILVLSSFVSARTPDYKWDFEGTNTAPTGWTTSNAVTSWNSSDWAYNGTRSLKLLNGGDSQVYLITNTSWNTSGYTITAIINHTAGGLLNWVGFDNGMTARGGGWNPSANNSLGYYNGGTLVYTSRILSSTTYYTEIIISTADGKWSGYFNYTNGTNIYTVTNATWDNTKDDRLMFRDLTAGKQDYVDLVKFYNCSIWNAGCSPESDLPSPSSDNINISIPTPLASYYSNNTIVNFSIYTNSTANFDVYFYLNETLNLSSINIVGGTNVLYSFPLTMNDGNWSYRWYAKQTADATQNENSTLSYFYIDSHTPTQTNNFSNKIFRHPGNYSYRINFSDNLMLWGFNVSINNALVNSTTNLQVNNYAFNGTIYHTNQSYGRINASLWYADAHTARETSLKPTDFNKVGNSLKVLNTIAQSTSSLKEITYIKSDNGESYKFCMYPTIPSEEIEIIMSNDCYYQNREDMYTAWFVCSSGWWDFVNPDYITSVKNNEVTVLTKDGEPTDKFCFSSVGSLNEVYENLTAWYFMDNVTAPTTATELQTLNFYLNLTYGTDPFTTNATLNYNGTPYLTTQIVNTNGVMFNKTLTAPTISTNTNISYYFNFTINGTQYNTTLTNVTIYNVNFDNCSTYSIRALNFTFYNITSGVNNLANATMTGHITTTNFGEFNITWNSSSNSGLCIYPAGMSDVSETQYQFIIPGCGTRNYYLDTTLSNSTQQVSLYCDSATSQVTFNVKDENDDVVPDVFIYVQKYDIGTGTASTVEIIKTDSNGQAVGNIVKNTQLYKFILVYNGNIVLETTETLILLDEYTFRVSLDGSDYFDDYAHIFSATCSDVTFTNATLTYSYTFLDPSGNATQGCLDVYLVSNTQHILVNSSCSSASSGTISVAIPAPVGSNSYIATGYVYIGTERFVCGDSNSQTFDVGWKDYGTESLFLSFLLLVFLITVGLWNPVVAIVLMMAGILLLNVLGLFHLGWGAIIGFVVLSGIVMYKMRQN